MKGPVLNRRNALLPTALRHLKYTNMITLSVMGKKKFRFIMC